MEQKQVVYRERIGVASAKNDTNPSFPKGERKEVCVVKLFNNRIAIYKNTKHFKETSGYKTYDSLESLREDFYTENILEAIR